MANGPVTLTATTGSITDSTNGTMINVAAPSATLNAATSIGDLDTPVTISVDTLQASTGAGGIYMLQQPGAVSISSLQAHGGPVVFENDGDITITGAVTSTTHGVGLAADNGSILGQAGTSPQITAAGNSVLIAGGGVLGTSDIPLRVNVSGGSLQAYATSQLGGISGVLTGTVQPSHAMALLNTPPGAILFNGIVVVPQANAILINGFGNPQANTALIFVNPAAVVPGSYPFPIGVAPGTWYVSRLLTSDFLVVPSIEIRRENEAVVH